MLTKLRMFAGAHLSVPLVAEKLAYVEKRVAHMPYSRFQAEGRPIGSGRVESGNKLVVEAGLKGAGMHWSRLSVNPLLARRNAVCNDRWAEAWQQSAAYIRRVGMCRREVQPKSVPNEEQSVAAAVPVEAVPLIEAAAPEVRPKPAAEHRWRQKNRATKAAIAQAAGHPRK